MEKVPYLLVLGKNEVADGTVSYRLHGEQNSTTVSREDFLALLKEDIRTKKINPCSIKINRNMKMRCVRQDMPYFLIHRKLRPMNLKIHDWNTPDRETKA